MNYLVKKGIYEPVSMYFRDISEGINNHMKTNIGLETHVNGKDIRNIDLHVTQGMKRVTNSYRRILVSTILENKQVYILVVTEIGLSKNRQVLPKMIKWEVGKHRE